MVEKRHPHFSQRIRNIMAGALIFAGTIFLNRLGFIGEPVLSDTTSILLSGMIIFSAILYVFWYGNHVKCPRCGSICERHSDKLNNSRKVVCKRCRVIWSLGVSLQHGIRPH